MVKKNKYLVSGMLFINTSNTINKKISYTSINKDNFSTIIGTGCLEICATQILINIFKFLRRVNCDEYL